MAYLHGAANTDNIVTGSGVTKASTWSPAPAPRVSPEELRAAALVFARALREHVADGLATGQLETALSGARCLEHLAGLAGPTVAAQAFAAACQEPDCGT